MSSSFSSDDVLAVIVHAASQDPKQADAAAETLKQMEESVGAWDIVHQISFQRNLPLDVRKMAALQFKNIIPLRWKSRKCFTDENRASIRARCLSMLDEADETISNCNAIVIAKICRMDPSAWSGLSDYLSEVLQTQVSAIVTASSPTTESHIVARRSLKIIAQVTKEFSSMKMLHGHRAMQNWTDKLQPVLLQLYTSVWSLIGNYVTQQNKLVHDTLVVFHMLFKPLGRMMLWLWNRPEKLEYANIGSALQAFFTSFTQLWQTILDMRLKIIDSSLLNPFVEPETSLELLTKHILSIEKSFRKWQRSSGIRFSKLQGSTEFILNCWNIVVDASRLNPSQINESLTVAYPMPQVVLSMALFRDSLSQWSPLRSSNQHNNVLSDQFVQGAIELLVSRFLPLQPSDLEKWSEDPEEWIDDEGKENDIWEFELRPCSARVIMTLAAQYPVPVNGLIKVAFRKMNSLPLGSLDNIVQKEALYYAMGCCATCLRFDINIEEWMTEQLIAESQSTVPSMRILKRRIAWIVAKWTTDMDAPAVSPTAYKLLNHLVTDKSESSDRIVRFTAVDSIGQCADTLSFQLQTFAPFIEPFIASTLSVIAEMEMPDNKRKCLSPLNILIEQSQLQIVPSAPAILSSCATLWAEAQQNRDATMKGSLLATLTHLLKSTNSYTQQFTPAIVPFLVDALSPENKIQLENDALPLWEMLLRNTDSFHSTDSSGQTALDLFPLALHYLANDLDIMGSALSLIQSYILLGSDGILQTHGYDLCAALLQAKSQAPSPNLRESLQTINLLIAKSSGGLWGKPLIESGLFASIVNTLIEDKVAAPILTEHIYILARICLADASSFVGCVQYLAGEKGISEKALMNDILDQWWMKFDNMSEHRHRKLAAMGIAQLVATGQADVLERLPSEIFNLWLDCLGEIREAVATQSPTEQTLTRHWQDDTQAISDFVGESGGTLEEQRRRQTFFQDPVQNVALAVFISERLQNLQRTVPDFENCVLAKVDPDLLKQIRSYLNT